METPPVGSLVVPSPRYRENMGTGEGAALLLALRRGSGNLFYAGTDRGFWVPMRDVRAIPPVAVPESCLERLLSDLLLHVRADECAIDAYGNGAMNLAIEIPALSSAQLAELRARLGPRLKDVRFEAGSMRAVMLRVDLVSLPEAAGAGR